MLNGTGLLFRFNNREAIMLPEYIKSNSFYEIKEKSGINPMYELEEMKFYQFKTVEIKRNDNI